MDKLFIRTALAVITVVAALAAGSLAALAQDGTPTATDPNAERLFTVEGIDAPILASADVAGLPASTGALTLDRLDIPAGIAPFALGSAAPMLLHVESGTLAVQDDFGFTTAVPAGSALPVPAGITLTVGNGGAEPVSLLRLHLTDAASTGAAPADLSGTPVAAGGATPVISAVVAAPPVPATVLVQVPITALPEGANLLFLARATFNPDAATGEQGHAGPIGLVVEAGTLGVLSPSGIAGTVGTGQGVGLPAETPLQATAGPDGATALIVGVVASTDGPFAAVTPAPEPTPVPTEGPEPTATPEPTPEPEPTPVPTEAVLYQADTSGGLGQWGGAGGWVTVAGMLVNDGTSDAPAFIGAPFQPSTPDYAVEVEMQWARGGNTFGVVARGADGGGYWAGFGPECNSSYIRLFAAPLEGRCGGDAIIGENEMRVDSEWHTYRLEVQGNVVRVFLDGGLVIETTDNRYLTPGQVGLWSNGAQVNVRRFSVIALGDGSASVPTTTAQASTVTAEGEDSAQTTAPVAFSGDLTALLPGDGEIPAQLTRTGDRNRSLAEVAVNYTDPAAITALFSGWGWQGNVTRQWLMPEGVSPGPGQINGVYVSIHAFDSPASAAAALDFSLGDQVAANPALVGEIAVAPMGDTTRALFGAMDYGNEITVLVQRNNLLIRLSASLLDGDPSATAIGLVQAIVGRVG